MFKDFELSLRRGKPVHLFAFARQNVAWRYCSADRDATVGGFTWRAAAISRSEIKQTVEKPQDQVTVTFPYSLDPNESSPPITQALGDNWRPYVPSDTVAITCLAYHANDPDAETIVEWTGRVQQPKFTDGQCQLTCQPSRTILNALRRGPKWGRQDWKIPYAPAPRGMGLKRADYEIPATVTAVSGLSVTAAEFAGVPYNLAGGELSWARANGITERVMILAHSGSTVTLLAAAPELAVGLAVIALPTCGHTWADFAARNNTVNFGGSIYMPIDDPYGGQSMSWG